MKGIFWESGTVRERFTYRTYALSLQRAARTIPRVLRAVTSKLSVAQNSHLSLNLNMSRVVLTSLTAAEATSALRRWIIATLEDPALLRSTGFDIRVSFKVSSTEVLKIVETAIAAAPLSFTLLMSAYN